MALEIKIKGNFLVLTDTISRDQRVRVPRNMVRHNRDKDDIFWFTNNSPTVSGFGIPEQNILGAENLETIGHLSTATNTQFPFADIIDERTGLAFTSADALDDYLCDNLGFLVADPQNVEIVGNNLDAFGRVRVSQQETQYYSKQLYDKLPLFVDEELLGTGTATHSIINAETALATAADTDFAILQTKQRSNYQSGKSQLIYLTMSDFHVQENIEKRIGYFRASTTTPFDGTFDGIFLENDGVDIRIRISRTGTDVVNLTQANWDDPLDGLGASGVTIDWEKVQVLSIDFQWLGAGSVRFFLDVDGQLVKFHEVNNANTIDNVYMSSPNQPLRWEIRQVGAGSGTFNLICASVNSEGPDNRTGKILSDNLGIASVGALSTALKYALIGLRLQAAKTDTSVDVLDFSVIATSNDNQLVEVWLNPTVAGTFTYGSVANSAVATAKGVAANTVTGGTLVFSRYVSQQDATPFQFENALKLGSNIDGSVDEFVITTNPLTNNSQVLASTNWRELL